MYKLFFYLIFGYTSIILVACNSSANKNNLTNNKPKEESEENCIIPIAPNDTAKYISQELIVKGTVNNEIVLTYHVPTSIPFGQNSINLTDIINSSPGE